MPKKMKKIIKTCDTISHIQQYECYKKIDFPFTERGFNFCDKCMADEIEWLIQQGIKTTGCCCGYHVDCKPEIHKPFINVDENYIDKMIKLGYDFYINDFGAFCFTPKTKIRKKKIRKEIKWKM